MTKILNLIVMIVLRFSACLEYSACFEDFFILKEILRNLIYSDGVSGKNHDCPMYSKYFYHRCNDINILIIQSEYSKLCEFSEYP